MSSSLNSINSDKQACIANNNAWGSQISGRTDPAVTLSKVGWFVEFTRHVIGYFGNEHEH